jgi:signal transduction histidine kinase/tetratricopeptide (TPR) repeat protein
MRKHSVFLALVAIFFLYSMGGTAVEETVTELEERLLEAATPGEELRYLGRLVTRCRQENPKKACDYGIRALKILQKHPDVKIKLEVLNGMCWAYCVLGEYRAGLDSGREAENLAIEIKDQKGLAVAYSSIANNYLYLSDFPKALDFALKAKTISENIGYKRGAASALVSIARVQRNLNEFDLAIENYEKAMEISEELGQKKNVAWILNNMATVYWNQEQFDKALMYYHRGLEIMETLNSQLGVALLMNNIGRVHSDIGNYRKALQYDRKALNMYQSLGNKGNIAFALRNIGRDYGGLKQYDKAFDYLARSLKMAEKMEILELLKNVNEEYTLIYESMGDYKRALFHHKKAKDAGEKMLNQDRNRRIAHLEVVYDVEKKQKENQLLRKNNHIQKLELDRRALKLERQGMQRTFLILVTILVAILALVILNRYRIRKRAEQVLKESEQKLKNMNAAKDRLFTIIAHDLGSPLNSILLSSRHLQLHHRMLKEDELTEFIANIYGQTRGLAELLENLLQWAMVQTGKIEHHPETVDLRLLTDETVELVKYNAAKKEIQLVSNVVDNTIAWADKHMMKAVIRNLVSNAVKYTHPGGEIRISSRDTGRWIEMTISDNGVGMEEEKMKHLFSDELQESTRGTHNEKGTGLGLMLCKEFVRDNGGEIRVESKPLEGSHFSFTLPKCGLV